MDQTSFWTAAGGLSALLTFLVTLFVEWPRVMARINDVGLGREATDRVIVTVAMLVHVVLLASWFFWWGTFLSIVQVPVARVLAWGLFAAGIYFIYRISIARTRSERAFNALAGLGLSGFAIGVLTSIGGN